MTGATGNIYAGLHEFEEMAFLLHFLRRDSLFVDVGANVGSFSVLASGVIGARTIAFEPVAITAEMLTRNLHENRIGHLVQVNRVALGAAAGEVHFTADRDTMNVVVESGTPGAVVVRMDTLDSALEGRGPELVKIDVEGWESSVLEGARRTLAAPELKALLIEVNSNEATAIAREFGFVSHRYDPFSRTLAASPPSRNALMVRDISFVQERLRLAEMFKVLGKHI